MGLSKLTARSRVGISGVASFQTSVYVHFTGRRVAGLPGRNNTVYKLHLPYFNGTHAMGELLLQIFIQLCKMHSSA